MSFRGDLTRLIDPRLLNNYQRLPDVPFVGATLRRICFDGCDLTQIASLKSITVGVGAPRRWISITGYDCETGVALPLSKIHASNFDVRE